MIRVVVHVFGGVAEVVTEPEGVECEIVDFDNIQDEHGLTKDQVYNIMSRTHEGWNPDALAEVLAEGA